jgi:hypothetical protein
MARGPERPSSEPPITDRCACRIHPANLSYPRISFPDEPCDMLFPRLKRTGILCVCLIAAKSIPDGD